MQELDEKWRQRMKEAEEAGNTQSSTLKKELDAKLSMINNRLQDLVLREAKRESKRAALSSEVELLRETSDEEFRRRCELEKALREAASLFKRELFEKNEELVSIQHEVTAMRTWHQRSLEAVASATCPSPQMRTSQMRFNPATATEEQLNASVLDHIQTQVRERQRPVSGCRSASPGSGGYTTEGASGVYAPHDSYSYDRELASIGAAVARKPAPSVFTPPPLQKRQQPTSGYSHFTNRQPDESNGTYEAWHDELSQRLDLAMSKLSPMAQSDV